MLRSMGSRSSTTEHWRRAASIAASQHGVVARSQLRDAGLSERQIDLAVAARRVRFVHRGVLQLGVGPLTPDGVWRAATLAAGRGAVLSHRSAASAWELLPAASTEVEVSIPRRSAVRRPGLRVHRHPGLRADEATALRGIPITTPARTLLDLAASLPDGRVRRVVKQSELAGRFDLRAVDRLMQRHPRHRGTSRLRAVLASWSTPPTTRSELEVAFVALCHREGFPAPTMNASVAGYEVDATFVPWSLAVELDGRAFHTGLAAWEDDHQRRADLVVAGWRFIALTHRQVTADGGRRAAALLERLLPRAAPPTGRSDGRDGRVAPR